jgi:cell wall-associated NlpC family hydrolase
MKRALAAVLLSVFTGLAIPALSGGSQASASVAQPSVTAAAQVTATITPRRLIAYRWAVAQQGKPYLFGATGPYGFDCSGLVYMAERHAGYLGIPRTTYGQLAWGVTHVIIVSKANARRGDLAFYGSGHVEFYVGPRYTFGAHHSGTRIGLRRITVYYHPTIYIHIRGSG